MNVTSKLKDPLPHITEHFASGGTRAGTRGSGDVSNIRDYCCFWDGEGKLATSSKVGKILETGVCHPDTRNVSVQINWYFVISTFQCLRSQSLLAVFQRAKILCSAITKGDYSGTVSFTSHVKAFFLASNYVLFFRPIQNIILLIHIDF